MVRNAVKGKIARMAHTQAQLHDTPLVRIYTEYGKFGKVWKVVFVISRLKILWKMCEKFGYLNNGVEFSNLMCHQYDHDQISI